ncbi:Peptidoglycan/xylan/chitin deacetylase, PgdA/CDA1 family [Halobacillus karajensis]|uniref:polysaccharide deacetylase family protein n=1 Tax=Halobacillus karajensis TaxID=195088 RepID=UPI0008A7DC8A|nr:polysaccharide deacetylase family protein [Halobacillus karajensis]SEH47968.1 Peptidoglycan/xylan/chitin deacetylase, PgdA/CDA1 family [Halobacillus karajensis]
MRQPIIYTILFIVLTATGCSFIASANEEPGEKDENLSIYEISMETDIDEDEEYYITAHYPQTPNNQIDQTIIDYVNKQKAYFKQESYQRNQQKNGGEVHELHIDFEVIHQDQRFFVVRFLETLDIGRDKMMTSQTIMNFDKKNGKALKVEELFKDDVYYVDRLHEWTKDQLAESGKENTSLYENLEAKSEVYENIAITDKGLMVFLEDPAHHSDTRVTIGKGKISHLIRSEYEEALVKAKENVSERTAEHKELGESNVDFSLDKKLHNEKKKVALTFDDGPHPEVTRKILDLLDKYHAKASFFMIGKRVGFYPDVAREVSERGHEIGNHTWDHSRLERLSEEEVEQQISSTQAILERVTGQNVNSLRMPFGNIPSVPYKGKLDTVPWTIHSEKWEDQEPLTVAQDILSQVEDGSIIMLHDLQNSTVETTDILLRRLSSEGYQVVPVGVLMEEKESRSVLD